MSQESKDNIQKATFAAGCFWGVEDTFRKVPGVLDAVSGYIGGHKDNPTYREVCNGNTDHAEAVEVTFDAGKVSFEELLDLFWRLHDPTQVNRQGPDVGTQYRSAIFYYDDAQRAAAEGAKIALDNSGHFPRPIATQIVAAPRFWRAEEYHQRYHEKHGGSCHISF